MYFLGILSQDTFILGKKNWFLLSMKFSREINIPFLHMKYFGILYLSHIFGYKEIFWKHFPPR